jgi:hypothetical protein
MGSERLFDAGRRVSDRVFAMSAFDCLPVSPSIPRDTSGAAQMINHAASRRGEAIEHWFTLRRSIFP